ncbi:MAG: hypothetical protein QXH27_02730 [Candidatus Micrarchaeia archaeon]
MSVPQFVKIKALGKKPASAQDAPEGIIVAEPPRDPELAARAERYGLPVITVITESGSPRYAKSGEAYLSLSVREGEVARVATLTAAGPAIE